MPAHPLSKLGEAQSRRLLCPGLNLANHTCEFCSPSRAPGTPFVEGLTAVSGTMIICALAPGFRQLSKAAIQHLAFPVAMKHSQDATGRECTRGKQGGLRPHLMHGKAGRRKNVRAGSCSHRVLPLCVTGSLCPPLQQWTQYHRHPAWRHCTLHLEASGWRHHGWRHCLPQSEQFMGHAHCSVGIIRVNWVGISEAGSMVLYSSSVGSKKDRGA